VRWRRWTNMALAHYFLGQSHWCERSKIRIAYGLGLQFWFLEGAYVLFQSKPVVQVRCQL
jgi:hypothetical protein